MLSDLYNRKYDYEYVFYIRHNNACPFLSHIYHDFNDVLKEISDIEKKANRYNWIFYIDNDFYNNYYNINAGGTYYKVLRRAVNDWEELDSKSKRNNIYFINNRNS